jgi:ATPase subunit of ABC transporter with duplicated ATPase domains
MQPSVTFADVSFAFADGTPVLDHVDASFGPGVTGLIGPNGTGKSTLLRLVTGELAPTTGTVRVVGAVAHLPQDLPRRATTRVDELLGIGRQRAALHAIEAGDTDPARFDALGDEWDVEERAAAELDRLGLGGIDLDRTVAGLSGGECTLIGLAGRLLRRPDVLLLDEPTNNLDGQARARLFEVLAGWRGVAVVVSHDRELLGTVTTVAELRSGSLRLHTGDLTSFEEARAVERAAAERAVTTAEVDLRRQERDLVEARTKLARSARQGRDLAARGGTPKILLGGMKRRAEATSGRVRGIHEDRVSGAQARLADARDALDDDAPIRLDLPSSAVPARRRVATLDRVVLPHGPVVSLDLQGPERIALLGANGVGKTTLLRVVAGLLAPDGGRVDVPVPVGHLPQGRALLDDAESVVEAVHRQAPTVSDNEVRAGLARLRFRGVAADQRVGTLSGGERLRATLAALLLADPTPQLLLLDEPTNDLDMDGVRHLTEALAGHLGAMVVVSHDLPFLRALSPTRWLELRGDGLGEVDPP